MVVYFKFRAYNYETMNILQFINNITFFWPRGVEPEPPPICTSLIVLYNIYLMM